MHKLTVYIHNLVACAVPLIVWCIITFILLESYEETQNKMCCCFKCVYSVLSNSVKYGSAMRVRGYSSYVRLRKQIKPLVFSFVCATLCFDVLRVFPSRNLTVELKMFLTSTVGLMNVSVFQTVRQFF